MGLQIDKEIKVYFESARFPRKYVDAFESDVHVKQNSYFVTVCANGVIACDSIYRILLATLPGASRSSVNPTSARKDHDGNQPEWLLI